MRLSSVLTGLGACAGAGALAGAGTLLYANRVGLTRFTTRIQQVELGGAAGSPLRILHISDIHYVPGQRKKVEWLKSLAALEPDLVINTGDNLSHHDAGPEVLEALQPLLELPGVFVPGSNDYYAPKRKNPLRYFRGPSQLDEDAVELPWQDFFSGLEERGWVNLANATWSTGLAGRRLLFSGVDDPHIGLDEFQGWPEAPEGTGQAVRIGVAHAPVSSILQQFAQPAPAAGNRSASAGSPAEDRSASADLVLCGHTHGGQVCLPGGHALVTNCDLPRRQAKGLSSIRTPGGHEVPLHVSAGIGTSATAQFRLNCPPEATLLEIR